MFIYGDLTFRKETKMKIIIRRKKIKTYDELKPWSLGFCHNGFTHKLIGPMGPPSKPKNLDKNQFN
jgi:hypothetical protein